MTFNLKNYIHKLYDYFLKHANTINNKLNKIRVFKYYIFKNRIIKILLAIIIFVLIFDKFTILVIMGIIYGFEKFKTKTNNGKKDLENYNNFLSSSSVEHYYDNIKEMSKVFKHPELNLNSYNNVVIDPTKVFLQDNKFLPECCLYNSDYSTSKGCACISDKQQTYLLARGTNKSKISFIEENNPYKNIYFSPTLAIQENTNPFNKHDLHFITGYGALNVENKNEFDSLTNLIV
jgi:hypothetical protein